MSVELTEREIVGLLIDSFGHKGLSGPLTYEQGKDGIDITMPTHQLVRFVRAIDARRAATSPAGDLVERLEAAIKLAESMGVLGKHPSNIYRLAAEAAQALRYQSTGVTADMADRMLAFLRTPAASLLTNTEAYRQGIEHALREADGDQPS